MDGGTVNASEVLINRTSVINGNGEWIRTSHIDWNIQIVNMPRDIAAGDDNTQLSESKVKDYVTNGSVDLATGSKVNGKDIITDPSNCSDEQILVFDLGSNT